MKKLILGLLILMLGFTMNVHATVKFNYISNGYVTDPSSGAICPANISYYFSQSTPFGPLSGMGGPYTVAINNSVTVGQASSAFNESFTFYVPCRNLTYSVTLAELNSMVGTIYKTTTLSSYILIVSKVATGEYNFSFQPPLGGI